MRLGHARVGSRGGRISGCPVPAPSDGHTQGPQHGAFLALAGLHALQNVTQLLYGFALARALVKHNVLGAAAHWGTGYCGKGYCGKGYCGKGYCGTGVVAHVAHDFVQRPALGHGVDAGAGTTRAGVLAGSARGRSC